MRARRLHLFVIQPQRFSKQVLRGHVVKYIIQIPNSLPQEDACSRLVVYNRTYRLPESGEHLRSKPEYGRSLKLKLVFLWLQIVTFLEQKKTNRICKLLALGPDIDLRQHQLVTAGIFGPLAPCQNAGCSVVHAAR